MKVGLWFAVTWIFFASLATAVFFSGRVRRELRAQRKPPTLRNVKVLFSHCEYLRSDVYGALVGWIGCGAMIVALILLIVHNGSFLR